MIQTLLWSSVWSLHSSLSSINCIGTFSDFLSHNIIPASHGWSRESLVTSTGSTGGQWNKSTFSHFTDASLLGWKSPTMTLKHSTANTTAVRKAKLPTKTHKHAYLPAGRRTCCSVGKWFLCCHHSRTLWWYKPGKANNINVWNTYTCATAISIALC